ncbi:MAG: geranylgeranyl reductase family protein [Candidatus Thorarchaeota archaeon]
MRLKFDAVVVGAGPAGSTAARILTEYGHEVLILDRRREVGVPVQCGGLIPSPDELRDMFPRARTMWRLADVSKQFVLNKTSHIRLRSPSGRAYDFPFSTNIVDRERFDKHLAQSAVRAGAELRMRSWVRSRTPQNELDVLTEEGRVRVSATVVIGADGPVSVISQSLGNRYSSPARDLSLSLQHYMRNVDVDQRVVEMLFGGHVAPGGYAWIIPRSHKEANVGFGLRPSLARKGTSLRQYLSHMVHANPATRSRLSAGVVVDSTSAIIPVGGPVKETVGSNCLLVGDAAGHVMATNGGGIPTALTGGYLAGQVASEYLMGRTQPSTYERAWKYEFGPELETARIALRLASLVMASDKFTEWGMRLLGSQFIEPVIRCRLPIPSVASRMIVSILGSML